MTTLADYLLGPKPPNRGRLAASLGGDEPDTSGSVWAQSLTKPRRVEDRAAAALGLDPSIQRGSILPLGRDASGEMVFAWPQVAVDTLKSLMLPGHVLHGGEFTPRDVTEMALDVGMLSSVAPAPAGAKRMLGGRSGGPAGLPMDEASRMARAKELGYPDEVLYRGNRKGQDGRVFEGGAHFSRDKSVASGHAEVGGHEGATAYRLQYKRPLIIRGDVTLSDYVDLIKAASPDDAKRLAAAAPLDGDWTPDRLIAAAERHGSTPIMNGAQVNQILEMATGDPRGTLRRAGFDAIDTGRDVIKLDGYGIRDAARAAFDPARASDLDTLAAYVGAPGLGLLQPTTNQDQR